MGRKNSSEGENVCIPGKFSAGSHAQKCVDVVAPRREDPKL